jgi:hypothetical protein
MPCQLVLGLLCVPAIFSHASIDATTIGSVAKLSASGYSAEVNFGGDNFRKAPGKVTSCANGLCVVATETCKPGGSLGRECQIGIMADKPFPTTTLKLSAKDADQIAWFERKVLILDLDGHPWGRTLYDLIHSGS